MSNDVHERIQKRLDELGLTPEAASRAAGLDKTYLRKLFARQGSVPKSQSAERLAQALGVSVSSLLFGEEREPERATPFKPSHRQADIAPPVRMEMPNDVPLMGTAAASAAGAFQLEGGVIDYVRRPPALQGAVNAYSIYIEGDSMWPEHRSGDLRFVHPGRKPRHGDTVVVQTREGPEAELLSWLGHYDRMTAAHLHLGKLNPKQTISIARNTIIAVHKVLDMNDLFGV